MSLWRRLLGGAAAPAPAQRAVPAPAKLYAEGAAPFPLAPSLVWQENLPTLDWPRVREWLDTIADEAASARAYADAELAWLAYLREALGADYRVEQQDGAVLLSSLEPAVARATLAFMRRTAQRIPRVLDGLTEPPGWGHDILLVLDDQDTYYRYVSRYYPDDSSYGTSAGMYLHDGCGHFVVHKAELHAIEPTIVHEMTHAMLSHLDLPTWVNEGLAVNTEHRLSPTPSGAHPLAQRSVVQQDDRRHRAYWNADSIQAFWSGALFLADDSGRDLAYNLGTLMVARLSRDWSAFAAFARAATSADGGQAAALEHLDADLGAVVGALFESDDGGVSLRPDPARWQGEEVVESVEGRPTAS